MKIEEMKKILKELEKNKKMYVEVIQNNELVNIWEDEKQNILQLTGLLYQVYVLKSNNIKCKYKYNYSDLQTITFVNTYNNYDDSKTITKYIFHNLPTNMSYLDIYKLNEKLESEGK